MAWQANGGEANPKKALTYIAAGLYLLVDAIFMTVAKPIAKRIDKHVQLRRLMDWIRSLPPYPSLALFSNR